MVLSNAKLTSCAALFLSGIDEAVRAVFKQSLKYFSLFTRNFFAVYILDIFVKIS